MKALKLPLRFDASRLLEDVRAAEEAWIPHHHPQYGARWDVLLLRSIEGDPGDNRYHESADAFRCTPAFLQCSYVPEVLEAIGAPTKRVRFLRLRAGASIAGHVDESETLLNGQVRLHCPVVTDPRVEFFIGHRRIDMRPGELWYLNTLHQHRVYNGSDIDRIHLVVDCVVNERINQLIRGNAGPWDLRSERLFFWLRPLIIRRQRWTESFASRSYV